MFVHFLQRNYQSRCLTHPFCAFRSTCQSNDWFMGVVNRLHQCSRHGKFSFACRRIRLICVESDPNWRAALAQPGRITEICSRMKSCAWSILKIIMVFAVAIVFLNVVLQISVATNIYITIFKGFFTLFLSLQDYKLDFFLRQLWNDPRLKHDWNETLALSNTMLDKIWVPDTYFENSKSSKFHKVTMVNKLLSISPNGGVHYNAR